MAVQIPTHIDFLANMRGFSILALIELFRRVVNFLNRITRLLPINSYAIYILHVNFFIGIEYALYAADIPSVWKFLISGVSAHLITLVISQRILKWIPILNLML